MENRSVKSVGMVLLKIVLFLIIVQCLRMAFCQLLFLFTKKTIFTTDIILLLFMSLFTAVFVVVQKGRLSFLPNWKNTRQKLLYASAATLLLILSTLSFLFSGFTIENLIIVLISAIVTPIFEELLFRGYIWNRLLPCFKNEWTVYIVDTLLFALWHLGYADTIWLRMSLRGDGGSLTYILLMKVITGLCFGIVLGLVRYKAKNCLASTIAHGILNLFGK